MQFGLQSHIVSNIQQVFSSFPEVTEALLYGSRAKGNFKSGSDIDITFRGEHLNTSSLNRISLKLDDLYLPYTFDLSVLSHIDKADLLEHISRNGISLYKRG